MRSCELKMNYSREMKTHCRTLILIGFFIVVLGWQNRWLYVAHHILRIFGTIPDIDDVIRIMIQINESC